MYTIIQIHKILACKNGKTTSMQNLSMLTSYTAHKHINLSFFNSVLYEKIIHMDQTKTRKLAKKVMGQIQKKAQIKSVETHHSN